MFDEEAGPRCVERRLAAARGGGGVTGPPQPPPAGVPARVLDPVLPPDPFPTVCLSFAATEAGWFGAGAADPGEGGGSGPVTEWLGEAVDPEVEQPLFAPPRWARPRGVSPAPPRGLLDATAPGALLAALVAATDPAAAADTQLVGLVAAAARLQAWAAAVELAATSVLVERVARWRGVDPPELCERRSDAISPELMAATEIGAACDLSPRTARGRVELAKDLRRLPATMAALRAGQVDLGTARMVVATLDVLDDEPAARVEARVLATAPGRTKAQLAASLRRAVLAVDPDAAERRHASAVEARMVEIAALPDGMAVLEYRDSADAVQGVYDWLTAAGQASDTPAARAAGDRRTLDQRRADVIADLGARALALGDLPTRHGRRRALLVVVAASTLLGLDDLPGELAGHGPIPASMARRIAGDATWQRILTDPRTGRFDEMSAVSYQPPQDLQDHVIARDRTCQGLGCRMPAERCDLDHRIPYPTGPTSPANLTPDCRPFHLVKTLTETVVEAVPDEGGGGQTITLPSGRNYHRRPEPALEDFSDLAAGQPAAPTPAAASESGDIGGCDPPIPPTGPADPTPTRNVDDDEPPF